MDFNLKHLQQKVKQIRDPFETFDKPVTKQFLCRKKDESWDKFIGTLCHLDLRLGRVLTLVINISENGVTIKTSVICSILRITPV